MVQLAPVRIYFISSCQ